MTEQDALRAFYETKALLKGHFLLRSGLHSDHFFQCALVLQHTRIAAELCAALAARFQGREVETVISPALGGVVVGQEVGRALGVRAIFAEKDEQSNLLLRRGFTIRPGERVLVAEDVVTKGGRVQQTIDLVRQHGGEVVGVAVIVDRGGGATTFDVPMESLVKLTFPTWKPEECPLCRQGLPVEKPGSK
ncbi:MAG: orotate phosphoribosyltransferase [Lentisphaeria bacterium]|jgi:orotate phosphoribosyltransferase